MITIRINISSFHNHMSIEHIELLPGQYDINQTKCLYDLLLVYVKGIQTYKKMFATVFLVFLPKHFKISLLLIFFAVNLFSLMLLTRRGMRTGFNLQLACLSGYNMLTLITMLHIFGLPQISDSYTVSVYPYIFPIV